MRSWWGGDQRGGYGFGVCSYFPFCAMMRAKGGSRPIYLFVLSWLVEMIVTFYSLDLDLEFKWIPIELN